jgi:hypothetical protein
MNYNFFAVKDDKLDILDYIFNETDLHIYDLSSKFGQEINEYKSVSEIVSSFDLDNGSEFAVTFQLWTQRHKGSPIFRKIILNPQNAQGYTFRYSSDGWGLIQLYFGGFRNNELNHSHIGHFDERGALLNEVSNPFNGKVNSWDWNEIQATSRKLKYYIHNRLSVRKIGSFGVLKGVDLIEKQDFKLR